MNELYISRTGSIGTQNLMAKATKSAEFTIRDHVYRFLGDALIDEYEKAIEELIKLISGVTVDTFTIILDEDTDNPDCKSIETISNHVISAGFHYLELISRGTNVPVKIKPDVIISPQSVITELRKLLNTSEKYFNQLSNDMDEDQVLEFPIKSGWGELYAELIIEHAIVHILRHRRQIQKFLLKL